MPGNETTEAIMRSATALGREVGLSSREFNVALKLAGLLDGQPGDWHLTELGQRLGKINDFDNGYGGFAHRQWDTTTWSESVIDKLDLSEAGIRHVRQIIADRKLAQKLARAAETNAADEAFLSAQAAKRAADAAKDLRAPAPAALMLGLGVTVTAAYGLYKAVPRIQRRRQPREQLADVEA